MKKLLALLPIMALSLLTGCLRTSAPADSGGAFSTEVITISGEALHHVHAPADGDNTIQHEPAGYCGNTVTTVTRTSMGKSGGSEDSVSFWGSDSVGLTDFLRWLDYSGDTCRCLPEYAVETEFGDGSYGVSLTGSYVRYDGKQAALTEEQVSWIGEIFHRQFSSGGNL